jgi:hypothetical protein
LGNQGRFAESLAYLKRGHELGSKQPNWQIPSADWVRHAEVCAAMEPKLPGFLRGQFQPRDNQERIGLAGVCAAKKLHRTAAGLYAGAFDADSKLADDLVAECRYFAICNAVGAPPAKARTPPSSMTRNARGSAIRASTGFAPTLRSGPNSSNPARLRRARPSRRR